MTSSSYETLRAHARRLQHRPLSALIAEDAHRPRDFALRSGALYASFARQRYDREALDTLFALAESADLAGALSRLFDGHVVNVTEGRAALHTALRSDLSVRCRRARRQLRRRVRSARAWRALVDRLRDSDITDIVSVGIGGSDLGPRLVADALSDDAGGLRVHFVSNVDGNAMRRTLAKLDPSRTAAVLISKTFGTQETLLNGRIVRDWLGAHAARDGGRVYAVSANVERAAAFGIAEDPHPADVGLGRWPLLAVVGGRFPDRAGDRHGRLRTPACRCRRDGCAHAGDAAARQPRGVARAHRDLEPQCAGRRFAGGAALTTSACACCRTTCSSWSWKASASPCASTAGLLSMDTVPVWWGGAGTDTQHSFFQALHQGTQVVPADFIGVLRADHAHEENHAALLANLLAQTEAFANGQASDDPHRLYAGNRPSTLLLLDALTPESLGALIALYEHSVYLQSVLWGINAFDQFGVELGKQVAKSSAARTCVAKPRPTTR